MWFHPVLKERILTDDNFLNINYLLNNISDIEIKIDWLLNSDIEKENPIYDENDYELSLLKTDKNFYLTKWEWYLDYEIAILQKDLENLISEYLELLKKLLINLEFSIESLFMKASDNFCQLYKLKTLDIFENISNIESLSNSEREKLMYSFKNNPYKILLKEYNHFHSVISILYDNISLEGMDFISQWNLISVWLPLISSDFKNLKKWEDNIVIKWVSVESIVTTNDLPIKESCEQVEKILKSLWVKNINLN